MDLNGKDWIPDEALEAMIMERTFHPDEGNKKTSRRLIEENGPIVTQAMIYLAIHSQSERIRLDAGKYLIDRDLGRVSEETMAEEDSPVTDLISSVLRDIEHING